MLKKRLIPTLLYKDSTLVKGRQFNSWRRVGSVMQSVRVYNMREVDELIFLDIAVGESGNEPDYELVDEFADDCFMPLTVGGGIREVEHAKKLLQVGADKIAINTAIFERPALISELANTFGSQCVVASIDVKKNTHGAYCVCTNSGKKLHDKDPFEYAKEVELLGAGEILITDVDRDGTMSGYNVALIRQIAQLVKIPVIASGGAGSYEDFFLGLEAGASAVAAASMYHFTEQTPKEAKMYLAGKQVPVRL